MGLSSAGTCAGEGTSELIEDPADAVFLRVPVDVVVGGGRGGCLADRLLRPAGRQVRQEGGHCIMARKEGGLVGRELLRWGRGTGCTAK